MIRRYLPQSTEELIQWYERYIAPVSLLAGFIADNIIFRAIDLWTMTFALALYLAVAVAGIFVLNLVETGRLKNTLVLRVAPFFPVVVQFAFGGIFSGFFVLYSESAALAVSWISVVILALLLIGNERFRRRYRHFSFQTGVLFIAILGFLVFLIPLIFKRIGPEIFLVSSVTSLALIALFVSAANRLIPEVVQDNLRRIVRSIGVIFLIFNVLYFVNAIPPLPLALKESGAYHHIERLPTEAGVGTRYRALYEPVSWLKETLPLRQTLHRAPGEPLYVFSAIFAPSGLSTTIYHEWENYDEASGEWKRISTVEFPVIGGRDGGYRAFSLTMSSLPGRWRVNVVTKSGQIIGRISFKVVDVPEAPALEEKVL